MQITSSTQRVKWKSGKPPSVGWWNASINRDPLIWRWWDGKRWSKYVFDFWNAEKAGEMAEIPHGEPSDMIEWNASWPENAAVPRQVQKGIR